ncbi:hypothetical protein NDU88_000899 [Pleurodeles waltl]|uniref:Uncharacterized protein n=1 Tax=Pleurodeles waltl TaxID=8319 RepID=A0AAV7SXX7_PLEWA|nr:hypothetical protein NDU88_000899 [Pleurodeles waltl]
MNAQEGSAAFVRNSTIKKNENETGARCRDSYGNYEEEFGQENPPSFEESLVEALDSNVQLSVNKALAKVLGPLTSHLKGFVRQQGWLPSIAAAAETPSQLTKPSKAKAKTKKWAHSEAFGRLSTTVLEEHGYSNPRTQEAPLDN